MGLRLQRIRDRILEVATGFDVTDTVSEHYAVGPMKRGSVAQTYYMHGQVGMGLWERGYTPPLMIAPATLKKWITDNGRADKDEIRIHAENFHGPLHEDHNVVDAVCLARMGVEYHQWQAEEWIPAKYQREKMQGWKRML